MRTETQRPSHEGHRQHRPPGARRHGSRIRRLDLEAMNHELRHRLDRLEARVAELGGFFDDRVRSAYLR